VKAGVDWKGRILGRFVVCGVLCWRAGCVCATLVVGSSLGGDSFV